MNTPLPTANVIREGEGFFADLGDHRAFVKVTAQSSNGSFLLLDCEAEPNGGVPPHIHHREDETFYVLSGRVEFLIGEQNVEVGRGDTVYAPRDMPHAWRVISPEGARLLLMFTPGDNFQSFGLAMAERGAVPLEAMGDPALVSEFVALAAEHGIQMLPPSEIK